MATVSRLPRHRPEPIGFAHRGARAHAPDNTIEGFTLALRLGATGLESDAWTTADGTVVLDHDGTVGRWPRRRPIGTVDRARLPDHIPSIEDLVTACGSDYELSIDVKDPIAAEPLVMALRSVAPELVPRLWLHHPDPDLLAGWRRLDPEVRLVNSTRLARMPDGPERRAAELAAAGIDAVNLRESDWTGGLTTLFHRFDLECFGWDAQQPRQLSALLDMGIDGVFSDHVDRMIEAIAMEMGADGGTT
jgi:glycerophosphoryl diester phosphodiesterase